MFYTSKISMESHQNVLQLGLCIRPSIKLLESSVLVAGFPSTSFPLVASRVWMKTLVSLTCVQVNTFCRFKAVQKSLPMSAAGTGEAGGSFTGGGSTDCPSQYLNAKPSAVHTKSGFCAMTQRIHV
jgi:hypothetical protein